MYEYVHPVLYRRHTRRSAGTLIDQLLLIAVPEQERRELMKEMHDGCRGGHLSAYKTFGRLLTKYYWPTMLTDCRRYCSECVDVCTEGRRVESEKTADGTHRSADTSRRPDRNGHPRATKIA